MIYELEFSAQDKIGSKLIQLGTWCDYSHVEFVLPSGKLFGARADGVKARNPFPVSKRVRAIIDGPEGVLEYAFSQEGKPYDFTYLLGHALRRDWQEDNAWVCSELVVWSFKQAGLDLLNYEKINRITPRDILLSPYLKFKNE